VPNAYLNYILFDESMVYQQSGFTGITTSAKGAFEQLTIDLDSIGGPGYLYVFVNNSSLGNGNNDDHVYFDELNITHTRVNYSVEKIQTDDYYPFGLQAATWVADTTQVNNFLYNASSELNGNTANYQTFFRDYDPALGRLTGIDIMAPKYGSVSPYNYALNDPIGLNDPNGDDPTSDRRRHWYVEGGDRYDPRNPMEYMGDPVGGLSNPEMLDGHIYLGSGGNWSDGISRYFGNFNTITIDFGKLENGIHMFSGSGYTKLLDGEWNKYSKDFLMNLIGAERDQYVSDYTGDVRLLQSNNGQFLQIDKKGSFKIPYTNDLDNSNRRKLASINQSTIFPAWSISITLSGAFGGDGIGYSFGYFSGEGSGGYKTTMAPEPSKFNLNLSLSIDLTVYESEIPRKNVSYDQIFGRSSEVAVSLLDGGISYIEPVDHFNTNSSYNKSFVPTYSARQASIGVGLPIGWVIWNAMTEEWDPLNKN